MTNNTNNNNKYTIIPDIKTKKDLIKLLSERANFTQKDTEIFLDSFIGIFQDACFGLSNIEISGLGSLKHTKVDGHNGAKPTRGVVGEYEKIWIPDCTRTVFSLSKDLKNLSKLELENNDYL